MTTEAMNMAIAEWLGWQWYRIPPLHGPRTYRCLFLPVIHEYEGQSPAWLARADGSEPICNWAFMMKEGHVQNYYGDLNACHEAEKHLPNEQAKRLYVDYLVTLMSPGQFTVMAAAPQRAKALLLTIGKWKEGV